MEVGNDSATSSLVNIKKPPTKGKKKKSAVAKLVEKKRNSDGGSECGSTISLQRIEHNHDRTTEGPSEDVNRNNSQSTSAVSGASKVTETRVAEENLKEGLIQSSKTDSKQAESTVVDKKEVKKRIPKPVPRRLNQKRNDENEALRNELAGGTVVSIYDKREAASSAAATSGPSSIEKTEQASSNVKTDTVSEQKKVNVKSDVKRELFSSSETNKLKPLSFLGPSKPRTGLSPLNDLSPLNGVSEKVKNVELSPPVPMDIDNNSDNEEKNNDGTLSKNAPSDATVHRFRAMRMAPDRCRSEESLKNAHFVPKPPSTPKSARNDSAKGEKRNREANSSGEEPEMEAKKHSTDAMPSSNILNTSLSNLQAAEDMDVKEGNEQVADPKLSVKKGLTLHPNITEVKDNQECSVQNVPAKSDQVLHILESNSKPDTAEKMEVEVSKNPSPGLLLGKQILSDSDLKKVSPPRKKGDKKKVKKSKVKPLPELAPLDGSDVISAGKGSVGSLGSTSDLKAINDNYRGVLMEPDALSKTLDLPQTSSDAASKSSLPEPKMISKKLSPIQPKNLPPPLPHDMKSTALRTAFKADPSYQMSKFFGRSFSGSAQGSDKVHQENLSHRSLGTLSQAPAVPNLLTRDVRDRMRNTNLGSSLLSSSELDKYIPDRKVGLWVGSWNMAEIKDCKEPLDDFLLPEVSEYVQDIYAIGTQENAMSKKEWEILLQETIGPSHVLFHSASHGALHLAVFVRRDLIWFCTMPEDDLVQTRAVTMVKTKGAIAVSFQFFGTSFLFINCHFAPGDDKKKERRDDYLRIIKNLNLPRQNATGSPSGSSQDVTTRYDCVFWMGDLNFRIEVYKGKQAVEDIVKSIEGTEHPNFEDLVSGDQLTKLIVEGTIFQGFQEGRINFRPTYKFDIGNDTYDTSSKNRIPSYTDRVLFRAKKKNSIVCTHYDSPSNVKISDHRPVFALFEAAVAPAHHDCTLPLAAGQFDRAVYTEANKRRSMKVDVIKTLQKEKSSKVCSIQ